MQKLRSDVAQVASGIFSTISGGNCNCASATNSTVSGGRSNCASGTISTVSGGQANSASANNSTVSGGYCNITNARHSTISGGNRNIIQSPTNECCSRGATIGGGVGHNSSGGTFNATSGDLTGTITCCNAGAFSTIGGGLRNCATGFASTVSGGQSNTASGSYSTVGGSRANCASGNYSNVSGGYCNITNARHSTINGGHRNIIQSPTNECCSRGATIGGGVGHNSSGGTFNFTTGDLTGTITCCNAGAFSTIGGGLRNIATGNCSTVSSGQSNCASGSGSTVSGGRNNTASGFYSTVSGGAYNTASGTYSTVSGGFLNTASGYLSTVTGGLRAKASKYGEVAHAAGQFAQKGDAQHSVLVARRNTTDATVTTLFLDGVDDRLTLPAETTWTFSINLSAYNDTDNTAAWWIIRGGIRRNAANGTALIGSLIEERDSEGTMSGTSVAVTADDTNEALNINVTGLASKNIRWVAVVDISQVSWGTP